MRVINTAFYQFGLLLFGDRSRLIEVYSALNMIAWAHILWLHPDLVERDTYVGFRSLGASNWSIVMILIASCQLVAIGVQFRFAVGVRIASICAACGVWFVVALNFRSSDVISTADANYLLLSLTCMATGAYIAWTHR